MGYAKSVGFWLASALVLAGCGGEALRETPVSIASDVFTPYTRDQYPETFRKWGDQEVIGRIQKLREDAARMVAMRSECDGVMLSELSDRSGPGSPPEVFVDCINGNRWRVRDGDAERSRGPDELNVYGA